MTYAFPDHLATQVVERWETLLGRHDTPAPPLPADSDLRHILSTAFFASLEREEGRNLRFVLCCAPDYSVLRDGLGEAVPVVPISPPRPVSVEAIRALAPAVSPDNAAILVRCPSGGPCEIAGILHIGSHLSRARTGRSFYYRPAPLALMIDVPDAGELHVYQGGLKVAALKAGRLQDQIAYSTLEFLTISDILACGEEALRPRIVRARARARARDVRLRVDRASQHHSLHRQRRARARAWRDGAARRARVRAHAADSGEVQRRTAAIGACGSIRRIPEHAPRADGSAAASQARKRSVDPGRRARASPDRGVCGGRKSRGCGRCGRESYGRGRRARAHVGLARPGIWRRDRARRGRPCHGLPRRRQPRARGDDAGGGLREFRHAAPVGPPVRRPGPVTRRRSSSRRTAASVSSGSKTDGCSSKAT